MPERRFDEKEVGQILSKAAAVQSGSSDPDSLRGITLEELQRVAQEVGLDPREIGRAAKSLESDRKVQRNRSANSVLLQQSVEGELSEEMWEQLVTAGRAFSGRAGRLVQNGATREWHSNEDAQTLLLSATTRNGRTQIRLLGDVSGAAILTTTFGSIFGIFASMAPMIYSTKQSAFVSPILTAVLTLLIVVTTALSTISINRDRRKKFQRQLEGFMDEVVGLCESTEVLEVQTERSRLERIARANALPTTTKEQISEH